MSKRFGVKTAERWQVVSAENQCWICAMVGEVGKTTLCVKSLGISKTIFVCSRCLEECRGDLYAT